MKDALFSGSCLCGAVRFAFDRIEPRVAHCHCSMCRKFHGAGFATIGSVPKQAFRWLKGEDELRHYRADNGTLRSFCGTCGSSLVFFSPRASGDYIELALGCVDSDLPIQPDAHIFTGSAANWTRIDDDLPWFETGRGSPIKHSPGKHNP